MKIGFCAAVVVLAVVAAGFSSAAPRVAADPPPPFPLGHLGAPVHAKAASGATADVTLNSATWFSAGCAGGWECNVIELTITGTSATPFKYEEIFVVADMGSGDSLLTHPDLGQWSGGDYQVNYAKIGKMPPLRTGSVTNGQTAHGFIGYGCNYCRGHLNIKFDDPDTDAPNATTPATTVAAWKLHT